MPAPPNRHKTHCPQGHPYTPANTYAYTRTRAGRVTTFRCCKACARARSRQRYASIFAPHHEEYAQEGP